MRNIFHLLTYIPLITFAQSNEGDSLLIPANFKLTPILDSINYINAKPRFAILNFLNVNKLKPENYYIDSSVHKAGDTLRIQVWDVVGIQTINRYERKRDSINNITKTLKGKKLKWPHPVGNPGNCFIAYFDLKNSMLITTEYWQ